MQNQKTVLKIYMGRRKVKVIFLWGGVIFLAFILCHFINYKSKKLKINRLGTHIEDEQYEQKKKEYEQQHKIVAILINCVFIAGIVLKAVSPVSHFITSNMESEKPKEELIIFHTKNDKKKEINKMFQYDLIVNMDDNVTEDKDENKKENKIDEFRLMLHFDWIDEHPSFKEYGRKILQNYTVLEEKTDTKNSDLTEEEKQKVARYSKKINDLQEIRKEENRNLTEDELLEEFESYSEICRIGPSAENIYQKARTAEDLFWMECSKKNCNVEVALKYGAHSIHNFEIFITYKDKSVDGANEKRIVQKEELLFRNGKVYNKLRSLVDNEKEKIHLSLCSYTCLKNITNGSKKIGDTNEWSVLGYYYLCHSIVDILTDMGTEKLTQSEYRNFVQEGKGASEIALTLIEEQNSDKVSKVKYRMEKNVENKLKDFRDKTFNSYDKLANFPIHNKDNRVVAVIENNNYLEGYHAYID